jgi:hypothetical protein
VFLLVVAPDLIPLALNLHEFFFFFIEIPGSFADSADICGIQWRGNGDYNQ